MKPEHMRRADYLNPPVAASRPEAPDLEPRPGHGRVWVNWNHEDLGDWFAFWDDGPGRVAQFHGDRAAVLEWARSRPAETFQIFSAEADRFVPLER